jgi:cob(I)alamin adenosyltransferase
VEAVIGGRFLAFWWNKREQAVLANVNHTKMCPYNRFLHFSKKLMPMANRLTKITTRTGDDGSTGLGDGTRVAKSSLRVQALGDVDELNCQLGVLLTVPLQDARRTLLTTIQHTLFELGGELSIPEYRALREENVVLLDEAIESLNASLPPLKEFILPGGSTASAHAHVARTVARRAERTVAALAEDEPDGISPLALQYLNRVSDLLFILARVLNRDNGVADVCWKPQPKKLPN